MSRLSTPSGRTLLPAVARDADYVRFVRALRALRHNLSWGSRPPPYTSFVAGASGSRARSGAHAAVELAKGSIEIHSGAEIDLDFLAREAGVSKYYLVRLFREAEGTTPWAYVRAARIRKAKELLAGGLPLAEIAILAGFYDQSHFSRVFREAAGMTPGQYREACKNVQD